MSRMDKAKKIDTILSISSILISSISIHLFHPFFNYFINFHSISSISSISYIISIPFHLFDTFEIVSNKPSKQSLCFSYEWNILLTPFFFNERGILFFDQLTTVHEQIQEETHNPIRVQLGLFDLISLVLALPTSVVINLLQQKIFLFDSIKYSTQNNENK